MGKPSSEAQSKKSNNSFQTILPTMSSQKLKGVKKKRYKKTNNRIRNCFEKLKRGRGIVSSDSSTSQEIVDSGASCDRKKKIDLTTSEPAKRRKCGDNSLILISDEDNTTSKAPSLVSSLKTNVACSTPIIEKDGKTLQNMIKSNFPNSTNNNSSVNINEEVINLTHEVHKDSYVTIDLTIDSENKSNTVIDLNKIVDDKTQNMHQSLVSMSNANLSMSGDSDVTVIQNNRAKRNKSQINKFTKGISKLNPTEKGKLLELIAQNIFNGCNISRNVKSSLSNILFIQSQATETEQDTYIKEVILGETKSRNSIGSNIYHPSKDMNNKKGLRMIIIDGSNVAMEHTKGARFSVKGLKICIDYFLKRGHVVKAFVPRFRCKYGKSTEPRVLDNLERQGLVVYTPSREIRGRTFTSYDDRYIVQCAAEFDGVIVSGDNYRDLLQENPRWRFVIENRLLPFTWVDDMIMFPRDPLGKNGPTLEQFLKHSPEAADNHVVKEISFSIL